MHNRMNAGRHLHLASHRRLRQRYCEAHRMSNGAERRTDRIAGLMIRMCFSSTAGVSRLAATTGPDPETILPAPKSYPHPVRLRRALRLVTR
jgi:hypothetical protein